MAVMVENSLAFHHAEIARLTALLAVTPPASRSASLMRTTLKLHEDMIARVDVTDVLCTLRQRGDVS